MSISCWQVLEQAVTSSGTKRVAIDGRVYSTLCKDVAGKVASQSELSAIQRMVGRNGFLRSVNQGFKGRERVKGPSTVSGPESVSKEVLSTVTLFNFPASSSGC